MKKYNSIYRHTGRSKPLTKQQTMILLTRSLSTVSNYTLPQVMHFSLYMVTCIDTSMPYNTPLYWCILVSYLVEMASVGYTRICPLRILSDVGPLKFSATASRAYGKRRYIALLVYGVHTLFLLAGLIALITRITH